MTSCIVPVLADDEKPVLTFIGDSMSFNFPSSHGYTTELERTFSDIVAEEFGYTLSPSLDGHIHRDSFALPGGRTTDALAFMSDDYDGDAYTASELGFNLENKEHAKEIVQNTDTFIIHLGYSNISVYLLNNLTYILGLGDMGTGMYFDTDLSQLCDAEDISRYQKMTDSCIGKLSKELGETFKEVLSKLTPDKLEQLYESVRYAILSDIISFDKLIARIRELNPDAKIYVMGLFNPAENSTLSLGLCGNGLNIHINRLFDIIFGSFNTYMKYLSPKRCEYTFVNPAKHVETYGVLMSQIGNERSMKYTKEIATSIFADLLDNQDAEKASELGEQYYLPLMQLVSDKSLNLTQALLTKPSGDLSEVAKDLASVEFLTKALGTDPNGKLDDTAFDQMLAHVYTMLALKGVYVHPTQAGHEKMAKQLISAMKYCK